MSNIGYATIRSSPKISRGRSKVRMRPPKMKKTLKQRFRDWLFENDSLENDHEQTFVGVDEENRLESNGMRFQLYRATGGYVIEVRSYDEHKDRTMTGMYVITDDKDLGEELGKIVTMECLKR